MIPKLTKPVPDIEDTSLLVDKSTPNTVVQYNGTSGAGNKSPVTDPSSFVVLK